MKRNRESLFRIRLIQELRLNKAEQKLLDEVAVNS